jgi:hypothetical protein
VPDSGAVMALHNYREWYHEDLSENNLYDYFIAGKYSCGSLFSFM